MRTPCVLACFALCGCEFLPVGGQGSGSPDVILFAIGTVVPDGPPQADFQNRVPDGMTHFFDNADHDNPEFLCQHDDRQSFAKMDELGLPYDLPCVGAGGAAEDDGSETHAGAAGTNAMPEGSSGWRGRAQGGCGVWSAAMCNRRLGVTDPESQVTETEWNTLADQLHLSASGGSTAVDEVGYYRSHGWCVEHKPFYGSGVEYDELRGRFDDDHCDVKMAYYRVVGDHYENGHIETVTSVGDFEFATNSWGHAGEVVVQSDNYFQHSGDLEWMGADPVRGGQLWPHDQTEVFVTYVCECPTSGMERLARVLFQD